MTSRRKKSTKCTKLCAKYRGTDRARCLARCYPGCRYAGVARSPSGPRAHVWLCPRKPTLKVERGR